MSSHPIAGENVLRGAGSVNDNDVGQGRPMNVLLLYADDWRYNTLGVAGNPIVETPVLDALSQEGVRFTENCVTTSICWISRATLYSGQYLARHKFKMIGKNFNVPQVGAGVDFELLSNSLNPQLPERNGV